MLRKILTIALVLVLVVAFGCKKKESAPSEGTTMTDLQKQVEKTGKEAKTEAGKELEKAGEELQE